MAQPVVSFFWYILQKGFEHVGIKIIESGSLYDAELSIVINSLTDEEIKFNVLLTKMGSQLYKKDYVVSETNGKTTDPVVLEQRAYRMIDSIVKTILSDHDFQKAFY